MRVAIYSRKSLESDKGDSVKNQIQIVKDYFRNEQCEFLEFQDEGFSGGNTNRPSFQLLLKHIKEKTIDVVAVYRIDRIARNIIDFVNFYDELSKHNIKLISTTEGFDFSKHMGKLTMMILATFADMERESIRQRVTDNMREMAKHGKWTGGNVPFGYTTERIEENSKKTTYLKIDTSKKNIIEEIFDYYIKTRSMHKVQKWLYTENDIKWNLSTVKNILTSPVYVKANNEIVRYLSNFGEVFGEPNGVTGMITYNRRPYTNGKHRWNDKSMFYSISKHEGIIESNKWLKVQSIQNETKTNPRPKNSQISYLTGFLKCSKCKSPITISHNHKNKDGSVNYVYLCTGRKSFGNSHCSCKQLNQKKLDSYVEDFLNNYSLLDEKDFLNKAKKTNENDNNKNISLLENKINSNNRKIDNLIDKISELSNEAGVKFMQKVEILISENNELKKNLITLKQQSFSAECISPQTIYTNFKSATNILKNPKSTIDDKRAALSSCIKEIIFFKEDDSLDIDVVFL